MTLLQKNIKRSILILLLFIDIRVFCQDPIYSQYYAHPLYTNPAFAGATEYTRFTSGWRNEWPGLGFNIYDFSFDQAIDVIHGGLGFLITNDILGGGTFSNLTLSGIYSYEINVSRRLNFWCGLQATYGQRSFTGKTLQFSSLINPTTTNNINDNISDYSKRYFDASLGFLASYQNTYAGIAFSHITSPKFSESSKLKRKYTFHIGQNIPTNTAIFGRKRLYISPNLLIQLQGWSYQQINYGLYFDQNPITLGFWLRQNINFGISSFIVSIGISRDNYQIAYSYDFFINRWESFTKSSANEVTFLYQFKYKSKRKQRGAIKCPKF